MDNPLKLPTMEKCRSPKVGRIPRLLLKRLGYVAMLFYKMVGDGLSGSFSRCAARPSPFLHPKPQARCRYCLFFLTTLHIIMFSKVTLIISLVVSALSVNALIVPVARSPSPEPQGKFLQSFSSLSDIIFVSLRQVPWAMALEGMEALAMEDMALEAMEVTALETMGLKVMEPGDSTLSVACRCPVASHNPCNFPQLFRSTEVKVQIRYRVQHGMIVQSYIRKREKRLFRGCLMINRPYIDYLSIL